MLTHCYRVHGLKLAIEGQQPILAALQARLACFADTSPERPPDLHFHFKPVRELDARFPRPQGPSRPVFDLGIGEVCYYPPHRLYLEVPAVARALAELQSGAALANYLPSDARAAWLATHPLFTIPLYEALKRRGIYSVHAAGLAMAGQGLLLAGPSGSGKTTLTIALLRAGFQYLGDDTVFLTPDLRVLAFPDEIDITATTASFFPELKQYALQPQAGQRPKRTLCATGLFGAVLCRECVPAVLVLPEPAASAGSTLTPVSKGEALLELCGNVLRTEPRSAQAHLDTLAALVERCRCYRLRTGRDFEALPQMLKSVLARDIT